MRLRVWFFFNSAFDPPFPHRAGSVGRSVGFCRGLGFFVEFALTAVTNRTPGRGNFALHTTPKAQPNKGATAMFGILRITRTSQGASVFYFRGCSRKHPKGRKRVDSGGETPNMMGRFLDVS